jgi:two-component system chemotaxis response regulator CheY
MVSFTLKSAGHQVLEAEGGDAAIKLAKSNKFDLIITDINMPDITGLELIRFVRESPVHAKVPLVIISTDGAERDRDRGLKLGADAYLVKPFAPEALVEVARRAVNAA